LFNLPALGSQFSYKGSEPLYRGVNADAINITDYHACKIHYWPCFSSTSKLKDFAVKRSRRGVSNNPALIFEIYTSTDNDPPTNVELPRSWSFYPSEKEVLLMPFFCFQVVSIRKQDLTTVITIIEVPHQNLLKIR
jgi:hypothetical protein